MALLRRLLVLILAASLAASPVFGITPAQRLLLNTGPGWVLKGSAADLYFTRNGGSCALKNAVVPCSSLLTTVRASTGYAQWADGHLSLFAANAPRITDQGLLVEEARTNLALQSQTLSTSPWTTAIAGAGVTPTITLNAAAAPDGALTASRVQLSLGGGTTTGDVSALRQPIVVSSGVAYTGSIYLKSNTGSSYAILLLDNTTGTLSRIVVTPTWQRFTVGFTPATTGAALQISLRGGQTPTNSDSADILAWGAQLEAGAFATSPIPTTTVAVTRAADSIQLIGAAKTAVQAATGWLRVSAPFGSKQIGSGVVIIERNASPLDTHTTPNTSTSVRTLTNSVGTATATLGGSSTWSGAVVAADTWDSSGVSISGNSGTVAVGVTAFSANPSGNIFLGSNDGATASTFIDNYIGRLTVGNGSKLSAGQLQALAQ